MRRLRIKIVVMGIFYLTLLAGELSLGLAEEEDKAGKLMPTDQKVELVKTGKIVYKFSSSEEMNAFEQMYRAKHDILSRIFVLENYLAQEKANLEQHEAQIYLRFKFVLEPKKFYDLDRQAMTIVETEKTDQPR